MHLRLINYIWSTWPATPTTKSGRSFELISESCLANALELDVDLGDCFILSDAENGSSLDDVEVGVQRAMVIEYDPHRH